MSMVQISTAVSKLGASIPCVNLPPIITCRPDAPCAKCAKEGGGCYALRGHFSFPKVKERLQENLKAYYENPKLYFETIAQSFSLYKYARFHSSGDIVDENYLKGMCWLARKCKNTEILCFTKKFELVNNYVANGHKIPKNLHIVFSTWVDFIPENPYNFPMSWVSFKNTNNNFSQYLNKIPKKSFVCSGSCEKCHFCFKINKNMNVIFKKH